MLLVEPRRGRQVVVQGCARCWRAGVRPGLSVAHARALLPADVLVAPHQTERDAAVLAALARWALRFTPVVQADEPEGLLLEITGCAHLFGGTRAMLQRVVEASGRLGFAAQAAVAPTVGAAWALARYGRAGTVLTSLDEVAEALGPLPVRALRVADKVEAALRAVAVETVEQLLALPRRSLAARFGAALLLRLDQALGRAFEAVEPVRPAEPVWVERTFAGPVKQLEAILQAGRELVAALCRELAGREAGARQLRLELARIDAQDLHETLTLSRPSRCPKHLGALLGPRLERAHLGFGIERMVLHATATAPLPHEQASAAEGSSDASAAAADRAVGELVDRLAQRFGAERVHHLEVRATHVPEQVFVPRPVEEQDTRRAATPAPPPEVVDADRPTLLHASPRPVRVVLLAPDGPVMTLDHGDQTLRIVTSIGPERITPRWWLVGEEARTPPPRDYFKVQDQQGRWWWLYRQAGTARWFVHGRWC